MCHIPDTTPAALYLWGNVLDWQWNTEVGAEAVTSRHKFAFISVPGAGTLWEKGLDGELWARINAFPASVWRNNHQSARQHKSEVEDTFPPKHTHTTPPLYPETHAASWPQWCSFPPPRHYSLCTCRHLCCPWWGYAGSQSLGFWDLGNKNI